MLTISSSIWFDSNIQSSVCLIPELECANISTNLREERSANPFISLIVPVYDEEDSVGLFIETTARVLADAGLEFEFVFVNDGSTDKTLEHLIRRSRDDSRIRTINLSRNFGKEAALTAGIDFARGAVLVPMDVDLQDPPDVIPRLVERWREGYDIVYGVRADRVSDNAAKRLTARWFYSLFNRLTQTKIPENAGDFRLIDRRVAEVLRQLPERNRFMKGLFTWVGFRSIGVSYQRAPRAAGTTKWNYWRLWNFALDGLVSFSTVPLRVWTYAGVLIALFSIFFALFIVIRVILFGIDVPGYASLMTVVLFIGGIQLLSLGVIGEYLARLFVEAKGRPIYVVDGVYEFGKALPASEIARRS